MTVGLSFDQPERHYHLFDHHHYNQDHPDHGNHESWPFAAGRRPCPKLERRTTLKWNWWSEMPAVMMWWCWWCWCWWGPGLVMMNMMWRRDYVMMMWWWFDDAHLFQPRGQSRQTNGSSEVGEGDWALKLGSKSKSASAPYFSSASAWASTTASASAPWEWQCNDMVHDHDYAMNHSMI